MNTLAPFGCAECARFWRPTCGICNDSIWLRPGGAPGSAGSVMIDESMDEVMDWIVSGVRADASGSVSGSPEADEGPLSVCGLTVGTAFEIVRDHEALRGRWRVVKIDRGPRGTLRAWARRPSSTDYLPLTESQIKDALEHGWLLVLDGDRRAGVERRQTRAGYRGAERRRGHRRGEPGR